MKKRSPNIVSVIILGFFVILWQVSVTVFQIPEWILPGPFRIATSLWNQRDIMLFHTVPTLLEAIIGLLIAIVFGVGISIAMKASGHFKSTAYPLLIFSQTIPFIALAPLLAVWFGFGIEPKIILIALVCFFPIAVNLFEGFSSVDHNMERFMIAMGATRWQRFRYVLLPASLPSLFSGLKVAVTYCILTAVVSEWIGTDRGLGILLIRSAKSYLVDQVFATVIIIAILSIAAVYMVDLIAKIAMPWHFQRENLRNSV